MMIVAAVTTGCTKTDKSQQTTARDRQPKDTVYTIKAAMGIYGYQPERALQIVDSALIVGNMTELQAEQCRARIYCMSLMKERVDSLLGGPKDVCLDSAQAIGERILHNDTIKNDLRRRQDVLEILAYTARMKKDTTSNCISISRTSSSANISSVIPISGERPSWSDSTCRRIV